MTHPSASAASAPAPSVAVPSTSRGARPWYLVVPAVASGAAGLWLAWHYPLMPAAVSAFFVGACLLFAAFPMSWLLLLPALLPVIDLAPWTGWITFEEVDLLVLAIAAGGYARLALGAVRPAHALPGTRRLAGDPAGLAVLGQLLFGASALWAMARGFDDAGGFTFGWFQGYREPMNSLRLAKVFFEAMLLCPLWNAARKQAPEGAANRLMLGLTGGLLLASLAALWERLAFTGLLNFSSDYRTTAMFWEMHVGGAALDGFLALTMPFAMSELLASRSTRRWLVAAAVVLLGAYACLTTFSRGVYLAVPVGLALTYALHVRQGARSKAHSWAGHLDAAWRALALALGYGVAASLLFPTSGYRGILALLGAAVLLLPLVDALRGASRVALGAGWVLGLALSALAAGGAWLLPKGAYLVYAGAVAVCAAALALQRSSPAAALARWSAGWALGGYVAVVASIPLVARHWGGDAALAPTWPVIAVLLLAALIAPTLRSAPWPSSWRWQVSTGCAMAITGSVVAAFTGGHYMTERFSTSNNDFAYRRAHWELGVSMLDSTDQLVFGKGLGRFPDSYSVEAPLVMRPGDYRVHDDAGRGTLVLVAGHHVMGWGELLRVMQRVDLPVGPAALSFDVRVAKPVILHFDLCLKHLLYDDGCLVRQIKLQPANDGGWQTLKTDLEGNQLSRGAWYAPKLAAFSISTETPDVRVELGRMVLTGADGRNLLANGDFSEGMSRWFFTSDRNHLAWHMKSMPLHVLFDQGVTGLVLWCALLAGAFWSVTFGRGRDDPLSPALAGALAGFVVVGLFDSLLDVPRVGVLFYLLVAIALARRWRTPSMPST